jgi:addiction module HigA family antidote
MPMKNPPHPGEHLRHDYLEPLGLSVTAAARTLGVTRQMLNNLVNGSTGISPEMAIRLSKAFGGSPEVWLGMQMHSRPGAAEGGRDQGQARAGRKRVLASD